jgi:hypothetical protein
MSGRTEYTSIDPKNSIDLPAEKILGRQAQKMNAMKQTIESEISSVAKDALALSATKTDSLHEYLRKSVIHKIQDIKDALRPAEGITAKDASAREHFKAPTSLKLEEFLGPHLSQKKAVADHLKETTEIVAYNAKEVGYRLQHNTEVNKLLNLMDVLKAKGLKLVGIKPRTNTGWVKPAVTGAVIGTVVGGVGLAEQSNANGIVEVDPIQANADAQNRQENRQILERPLHVTTLSISPDLSKAVSEIFTVSLDEVSSEVIECRPRCYRCVG